MRRLLIALGLGASLIFVAPAQAQDTPPGYKFCGWQDFGNGGGWTYEDTRPGAYLALYSRNLSCQRARRNCKRVRYPAPDYKPTKRGYRCVELQDGYEYSDVRCTKIGRPRVAFRWRTGA